MSKQVRRTESARSRNAGGLFWRPPGEALSLDGIVCSREFIECTVPGGSRVVKDSKGYWKERLSDIGRGGRRSLLES